MLNIPFRFLFCALASLTMFLPEGKAAVVLNLDLSNAPSFNAAAHPANAVFIVILPANERVDRLEFDIRGISNRNSGENIALLGESWASEARIRLTSSDDSLIVEYRPYSSPAYDFSSTSDPADLRGYYEGSHGLPWTVPAGGGSLRVELYESLDDNPERVDGFYAAGSALRIIVAGLVIPEPGVIPLLLPALLLASRRTRGGARLSKRAPQ